MIGPLKTLSVLFLFSLVSLVGCADRVPVQPAPSTGTVFQQPLSEVQNATRNALTHLGFAITKESEEYIEAVHLKPGETVEDNDSELVGIWFKPRESSVLVLTHTALRPSGIAKQREWDQAIISRIMQELP
ncbi:MAG: hypothetical protein VR65_18230 [Desulfobulbaceae bacterium BRH_c16a]|nr:MAG: hypothetical protein VR65_18230 [Desulfobulbaceae bacterium BRH_c16a]